MVICMGVMVQIRNVPEDVHRTLKSRAAASGMSLSEYLRGMLEAAAARPSPEEWMARVRARGPAGLDEPSEVSVRQVRDSYE